MSARVNEPLPVIKARHSQVASPRKPEKHIPSGMTDERRKTIEQTLTVSAIKPEPKRPPVEPQPAPPPAHERLYKQTIGNSRRPIRRMRSRSAGDIEQLHANRYVEKQLQSMTEQLETHALPSSMSILSKPNTQPRPPTTPSTNSGRRPTLLRKPSQDDSTIHMRTPQRPSFNLVPAHMPVPDKNTHSPFDRCSMFAVSKYTTSSPQPPPAVPRKSSHLRQEKSLPLTNIKNGLEKGLLKFVFTGPAVFWKKRLTLTVSVYLHEDSCDCFEVVAEAPTGNITIPRLFVQPSVLYMLKEKYFQSKLREVSTKRKDLMEQARLHLAGELIVSTLRIDEDITHTEEGGDLAGNAGNPHSPPGTIDATCAAVTGVFSGKGNSSTEPHHPAITTTTTAPSTTANSTCPSTCNAAGSLCSDVHAGDCSNDSSPASPGKGIVHREIRMSLPHYNGMLITLLLGCLECVIPLHISSIVVLYHYICR